MVNHLTLVLLFASFLSCKSGANLLVEEGPTGTAVFQAMSLTGDSLFTTIDSATQEHQIRAVRQAESAYQNDASLANLIWLGRRQAYLGRYDLAIDTYSEAINKFPDSYEALRHRGHRYITIREFDKAIGDFEKAASLMASEELLTEQDGMPNKENIPLTTVQFNVWYHLGLAHYLKEDYQKALSAYEECMEVSNNDDLLVATLDWKYMTMKKLGKDREADHLLSKVTEDMNIIENDAYYYRLLMYKGVIDPEELIQEDITSESGRLQYVTQGYGLGNHYLRQDKVQEATETFLNVMKTNYWAAFGYIASEMELARLK